MRNFILGFLFCASLLTGVHVAASNRPIVTGESGTLDYRIVIDGNVICDDPWVSIPEKLIECDEPYIDDPKPPKKLPNGVVTE